LFGRPVKINVLFEPVKGEFHEKYAKRLNFLAQTEFEKLF
jgi:hypothetical protein